MPNRLIHSNESAFVDGDALQDPSPKRLASPSMQSATPIFVGLMNKAEDFDRPVEATTLLGAMAAIFFASVALVIVIGPMPIGYFWWDWIALIGTARAIDQGLTPFSDFWTTFLFPIWEILVAEKLTGLPRAFMALHLVQVAISFALLPVIALGRLSRFEAGTLVIVVWVGCFVPFNNSHVSTGWPPTMDPYPGLANFNGFYNRFNGALLLLAFVASLPPQRRELLSYRQSTVFLALARGVALGVIGLILFLSKMSAFFVFGYCLVARAALCYRRRETYAEVLVAALAIVTCLLAIEVHSELVSNYLQVTNAIAALKKELFIIELKGYRIQAMTQWHGRELLLIAAIILGLAIQATRVGIRAFRENGIVETLARVELGLPFHLVAFVSACMLNTITNFGDQGLLPAFGALGIVLSMLYRRSAKGGAVATIVPRSRFFFWSRYLAGAGVLYYFWFTGASLTALTWRQATGAYVPLASGVESLDSSFVVDIEIARRAATLDPIQIRHALSGHFFQPQYFVALARSYGDLTQLLRERYGDRELKAVALSFPALLASAIANYQVPAGAYSWLLIGHEIALNAPPPTQKVIGHADIVLVDLCEPHELNRAFLPSMFRKELDASFRLGVSSKCWQIYERSTPYAD